MSDHEASDRRPRGLTNVASKIQSLSGQNPSDPREADLPHLDTGEADKLSVI